MQASLIAIAATAFSGLLLFIVDWLKQGQAQSTGAQLQAAVTTTASAKVETAIAQAVVDAPQTKLALVDRLNAGRF